MTTVATNLANLFDPASIAVVGASNKPGKMGNAFINRLAHSFAGKLYAINPSGEDIAGVATFRDIADVPDQIDLLIALVPAQSLVEVVTRCAQGQVRFLAAIPSGFAEVSADGQALQQKLVAAAAERGIRVLGPNVVGLMNAARGLNASMMPELPPGGAGLSCVTQSGGFGMALSMYALDHALPVAKFCDIGNSSDIDLHEVIDFLSDDAETKVIGLFLESLRDPDRLVASLDRAVAKKPVILSTPGVTAEGRRASLAHLGLQLGAAQIRDRLPKGVILAETGLELLHAAKSLMWQRGAQGRRVAVLTGTGGIGAELSDLCVKAGLSVPVLSQDLQARLRQRAALPYFASAQNPIDCTPVWWDYPKIYPAILEVLTHSEEVDLAIVSITDVAAASKELAASLSVPASAAWLPRVIYWGARHHDHANMMTIEGAKSPCFTTTAEAVRAAAFLAER